MNICTNLVSITSCSQSGEQTNLDVNHITLNLIAERQHKVQSNDNLERKRPFYQCYIHLIIFLWIDGISICGPPSQPKKKGRTNIL